MADGIAHGRLTLLRIHEVGTTYGGPGNSIDVEVVIKLATRPDNGFGFKLRNDTNGPVHRGMLDLLRSAYRENWQVSINYNYEPSETARTNFVMWRVWVERA